MLVHNKSRSKEIILESCIKLWRQLGGEGLAVTVIVEDTDQPNKEEGMFISSNLADVDQAQGDYLIMVGEQVKKGRVS